MSGTGIPFVSNPIEMLRNADAALRRFGRRANVVRGIFEAPCSRPWHAAAVLALPALGDALLFLGTPSWDEILEEFLKPKGRRKDPRFALFGGRTRERGRGGKVRKRFPNLLPDVDKLVAAIIPFRKVFAGRNAGKLESFFWTAVDVGDAAAFFWLVAEALDIFAFSWSTGLMESRFCSDPPDALFAAQSDLLPGNPQRAWFSLGTLDVLERKNVLIFQQGEVRVSSGIVSDGLVNLEFQGEAWNNQLLPAKGKAWARVRVMNGSTGVRIVDGPVSEVEVPKAPKLFQRVTAPFSVGVTADISGGNRFFLEIQGGNLPPPSGFFAPGWEWRSSTLLWAKVD